MARDADYWHYLIESWKARDRIARIADPAQWAVDFDDHLQPAHAAELFARIRRDSAARFSEDSEEVAGGPERIGSGTSGFVVADADGNMIAVTQTLSTWGGSFYVTRGLGFLYNNHLRSNRTTPGAYGQLMPWTRSNTANLPVLAFRSQDGQPAPSFAVASAGNAWIPASTYSIVTAVVDGGLSMQQAIEAPRFLVTRDPADPIGTGARVEIEDRFPRADPAGSDDARPPLPEDRPQGRAQIRLRVRRARRCRCAAASKAAPIRAARTPRSPSRAAPRCRSSDHGARRDARDNRDVRDRARGVVREGRARSDWHLALVPGESSGSFTGMYAGAAPRSCRSSNRTATARSSSCAACRSASCLRNTDGMTSIRTVGPAT